MTATASTSVSADFIGRDGELRELHAALDEAMRGHGRCLLISGDAGIGKTRLAEQFGRAAQATGCHVVWGRCWEGGGAPAFWPWAQMLRSYLHDHPAVGPGQLGAAWSLVSEESARDGRTPNEPEPAPFKLFTAVQTFLKQAAATRPLVVVLDDFHAADPDSWQLLRFVARELPRMAALVVVTFQEAELRRLPALAQQLSELGRDSKVLPLKGLGQPHVAELIAHMRSRPQAPAEHVPEAFVTAIHQVTEGNPFFVDSIVRLLASQGEINVPADPTHRGFQIPEQVRETVRRRLAPLSAAARRLLMIAAVMGREFDTSVLQHVGSGDYDVKQLATGVDEAITAGVIVRVPNTVGRYTFAHALIRETLYDDLASLQQAELHHQIAKALVTASGIDEDLSVAQVAHHCYRAIPAGYLAEAVEALRRAARRATAAFAFGDAVQHWERAREALDLLPADSEGAHAQRLQRCELLLGLGSALNGCANRERAREVFAQAAASARAIGAAEHFARAALGYGGDWLGYVEVADFSTAGGVFDDLLTRLLTEALQMLGAGPSALHARLLSRLAVERYFTAPGDERVSLSEDAAQHARAAGDTSTLAHVLSETHVALWGPDNTRERLHQAREVVVLGQASLQPSVEAAGRSYCVHNLLELGEMEALAVEADTWKRFAERTQHPGLLWAVKVFETMQALLAGRYVAAEQLARETFAVGRRAQRPALLVRTLQLIALYREQGRLSELAQLPSILAVLADQYPAVTSTRTLLAFFYAQVGQLTEARSQFEYLVAQETIDLPRNLVWLASMTELSEVCAELNDRARAATLYERLLPYGDRHAISLYTTVCWGSVARVLGLLATVMGQWDAAERHFGVALERNRALGSRPWMAHTQVAHAAMLIRRGADHAHARALLAAAFDVAHELGMKPLAARIESLRTDLEHVPAASSNGSRETPPQPQSDGDVGIFRREGDYWTVRYGDQTSRLKHTSGLAYIAELLREPGRELHALDLVGRAVADRTQETPAPATLAPRERAAVADGGDGIGPLLDPQAKAAYRERLRELQVQLEDAQTINDAGRAEQLRGEMEFLTDELARAVGLGGRDRRAGSHAERARVNVTRSIASALKRIHEHDGALGQHLARTIRAGTFCIYAPDPRAEIQWQL